MYWATYTQHPNDMWFTYKVVIQTSFALFSLLLFCLYFLFLIRVTGVMAPRVHFISQDIGKKVFPALTGFGFIFMLFICNLHGWSGNQDRHLYHLFQKKILKIQEWLYTLRVTPWLFSFFYWPWVSKAEPRALNIRRPSNKHTPTFMRRTPVLKLISGRIFLGQEENSAANNGPVLVCLLVRTSTSAGSGSGHLMHVCWVRLPVSGEGILSAFHRRRFRSFLMVLG